MAKKIMMMFLGITMLASLTACAAKGASGQDTVVSAAAEAEVAEEADLVESEEESAEEEQVDMPEDPTINPDNAQFWREALQKYRDDDNVHQVLLVRYTGGCSAIAKFYVKSEYNNAWELKQTSDVYVGKHGIGKTGEGDAKTPTADLGVQKAFGILPNPGTSVEYIDVKETTYACDEDCEYYNQIIDTEETGHDCKGEEMFRFSPEYNYGFATDFNAENAYPNGSAIFVHCKGEKAFTGGCIAFDQEDMKYILMNMDQGMRIIIGED